MTRQREGWTVAAVLLAGFALRMFFLSLPVSLDDDTAVYAELARNWFHHRIYGFTDGNAIAPTLIRLPGYPFFFGVIFAIFGGGHLRPAMISQTLADVAGCWLLFDCVRSETGRRAGWAALLLAAFCPFTAAYSAAGMTESLSLNCVALAIWSLTKLVRGVREGKNTAWTMLGLAVTLGYALVLRPDGVLLAAAFSTGLFWYTRHAAGVGRALRLGVTAGLLAVLPLVPWTVRNYRTFHVFQPIAPRYANNPGEFAPVGFFRWMRTWSVNFIDAGTVFWNLDDTIDPEDVPPRACWGAEQCEQTARLIAEHNQLRDVPPALDAQFAALAAERIRERPWDYYIVFPLWRLTDMVLWPRTELFNVNIYWWKIANHPLDNAIALGLGLINLGYIVLGVVGFVRRKVPLPGALLGFVLLRCILLATVENPEQRYTMVMYPVVILAAACAFARSGSERDARDAEEGRSARLVAI
ncbi:MAG TPA: glycosyltransferase family 39 protein [Acidobacteriaceae bacterium]|nr:glycosyltransferase family 39 protein [Acidobacteriaceae bacterium]